MKFKYKLLVYALLIGVVQSCSKDNQSDDPEEILTDPTEYTFLANVPYGENESQIYDLYLPKNRTLDTRVMVMVHGGGWNAGDKSDMNDFKDYLHTQFPDMAVVNLNYRLADKDDPPYPMQINDISAVVNDLRAKQKGYYIGTDLGFIGASAGAHLSLLWAYKFDSQQQVKMVCSIVGPTNLADDAYINSESQELKDLIFQFGTNVDGLKEVSPLFQVKANAPPTILFYGAQDPLIPVSQGSTLNAKLQELDVPHEYTLYPNGGHGWIGLDLLDTSIKLKTFIDTYY